MTCVVAATGSFHLNDIRAHIRKHLAAPRPGQYSGNIEYFYPGQWFSGLTHNGLAHKGCFLG
ncbi:hypothetical protein HSBAA_10200 [Vreelandella sulfidaeris]|uniref:Uncharacterized protein n=1 Tax=Vreelandella sulfidaeris TaxID=115553 RepID=A0A455U869_9GAMM|nr:hypothetical protein HSBAA_10200 [Halomonas sulfidaeris]